MSLAPVYAAVTFLIGVKLAALLILLFFASALKHRAVNSPVDITSGDDIDLDIPMYDLLFRGHTYNPTLVGYEGVRQGFYTFVFHCGNLVAPIQSSHFEFWIGDKISEHQDGDYGYFFNVLLHEEHYVNKVLDTCHWFVRFTLARLVSETSFLPAYYRRSELVWLDGFLLDFLQKKSLDTWLRKFVLVTGYIFSERMVFDQVVRIYMDNLIWPLHYIGSLETSNVSEMLSIVLFLFFFFLSLIPLLFFLG